MADEKVTLGLEVIGIDHASKPMNDVNQELANYAHEAEIAQAKATILNTVWSTTTDLLKSSYNAYTDLAEGVRDLSLISGQSAEDTSRFIQVLDDFQLTADDATTAAKKLKEQGLTPNIETLAMLSDEFRKIEDPAMRMQFIQDNLGKSGAKWVNVLNQGGDALRKLSNEVDRNLILTDNQIRLYEMQRLALDDLQDRWQGFQVQLGSSIGNVIAYNNASLRAVEILKEQGVQININTYSTQAYKDAVNQAIAEQLRAADASVQQGDSLMELEAATKAAEEAMKELSDENKNFLSTLGTMQKNSDSFAQKYKKINEDMNLSDEERREQLDELAKEHERVNREIILGLLERKLTQDGILDDRELEFLLEKGRAWGIYSDTVVNETRAAIAEANRLAATLRGLPTQGSFTYSINVNDPYGFSKGSGITYTSQQGGNQFTKKYASGGNISAGGFGEVAEGGVPETLTMGNKKYLLMPPNKGGYITPMQSAEGGGWGNNDMKQVISLLQLIANKAEFNSDDFARNISDLQLQKAR